jgi:DivIVA domain-containing protein
MTESKNVAAGAARCAARRGELPVFPRLTFAEAAARWLKLSEAGLRLRELCEPRIGVCLQSATARLAVAWGRGVGEPRRVPAAIRSVAFPVSVRGYDRRAVDAYVTRVNRVIAELEATRSPQSAVNRALERSEEERSGILEQARKTAEEITEAAQREAEEMTSKARAEAVDIVVNASDEADRTKVEADGHVAKARTEAERIVADSRTEAADRIQRAQAEIGALRDEAEAWMRALRIDTNVIWGERRDLLDDLRDIAARLREAASHAGARAGSRGGSSV